MYRPIKRFLLNRYYRRETVPPMDFVSVIYKSKETANEPSSLLNDLGNEFSLSYKKRLFLFLVFLFLGILFCFLAAWKLLSPKSFAKYYTLGTVCIISSTLFLVGPQRQLKNMFDSRRLMASLIYLVSIIVTLYSALVLQRTGLTILAVIMQFSAALWYAASYVPFAQECFGSTARMILPL